MQYLHQFKTVSDQQDALKSEKLKLLTSRVIADRRPTRTNQFEVSDQLHGLTEKFRVLNNDELADALEVRLVELSTRSTKWTPEVLSLLLHLSDKPVEKTRIEDLAIQELEPTTPVLKWSDILADDPLDDADDIWDSIDYAADSSDEDKDVTLEISTIPELTPDSSSRFDDDQEDPEAGVLMAPIDRESFNQITNAQFWRIEPKITSSGGGYYIQDAGRQPKVVVTEAQMIREVTFMLLGLPTSIFASNQNGEFMYSSRYELGHISSSSLEHLMNGFTSLGSKLASIRAWTRRIETVPVEQTFQAALASRIRDVDVALSAIEARMLNPVRSITISLLDLMDEVSHIAQFMQTIAEVVTGLKGTPKDQMPFKILECLFDRTCTCQSLGDEEGYEFMAQIFFECFHTYLKPVRMWMETGELSKQDRVIFIERNEEEVALDSMWGKQYYLRYDGDGHLYAPSFLHVAAKKIFTTGKSVNLLRELGHEIHQKSEVFQLDYKNICQTAAEDMLSPFSELLDMALDGWLTSMHHSSSQILRNHLESQCGLSRCLDALEYIYFYRNGALSDVATDTVFKRIDGGNQSWNDGSVLTERFQAVFGPLTCIDAERLIIGSARSSDRNTKNQRRSVKLLDTLRITYTIPWPIANILTSSSLSTYQRVSTFLLQIHRAKHLLQRHPYLSATVWKPSSIQDSLTCSLRYRLLWFANTLLTYLTEVVLSVSTTEMRMNMTKAEDVDAMITVHQTYIMHLEEQCLISKRLGPIHQAIISMLDIVVLFSDTHSVHTNPNHKSQEPIRRRKKHLSDSSDEDSSSSEDLSGNETNTYGEISFSSKPYEVQLREMHDTFAKLLAFVAAGLRGVSRAGGEVCWEVLAEMLGVWCER